MRLSLVLLQLSSAFLLESMMDSKIRVEGSSIFHIGKGGEIVMNRSEIIMEMRAQCDIYHGKVDLEPGSRITSIGGIIESYGSFVLGHSASIQMLDSKMEVGRSSKFRVGEDGELVMLNQSEIVMEESQCEFNNGKVDLEPRSRLTSIGGIIKSRGGFVLGHSATIQLANRSRLLLRFVPTPSPNDRARLLGELILHENAELDIISTIETSVRSRFILGPSSKVEDSRSYISLEEDSVLELRNGNNIFSRGSETWNNRHFNQPFIFRDYKIAYPLPLFPGMISLEVRTNLTLEPGARMTVGLGAMLSLDASQQPPATLLLLEGSILHLKSNAQLRVFDGISILQRFAKLEIGEHMICTARNMDLGQFVTVRHPNQAPLGLSCERNL